MSQVSKYKKGKYAFEILTKTGAAKKYLEGKLGWDNVLAADVIFTNSKKGNVAKSSDLKACFNTDDVNECAKQILAQGNTQVSAAERKEDISAHRKKVAAFLHKTYTDQAGTPHPLARINNILDELKLNLDPSGNVANQAEDIVKKMQGKIVFKLNTDQYELSVKKSYKNVDNVIAKYSPKYSRKNENNLWKYTISLPPGDVDNFMQELNKVTEGDYTFEKK